MVFVLVSILNFIIQNHIWTIFWYQSLVYILIKAFFKGKKICLFHWLYIIINIKNFDIKFWQFKFNPTVSPFFPSGFKEVEICVGDNDTVCLNTSAAGNEQKHDFINSDESNKNLASDLPFDSWSAIGGSTSLAPQQAELSHPTTEMFPGASWSTLAAANLWNSSDISRSLLDNNCSRFMNGSHNVKVWFMFSLYRD